MNSTCEQLFLNKLLKREIAINFNSDKNLFLASGKVVSFIFNYIIIISFIIIVHNVVVCYRNRRKHTVGSNSRVWGTLASVPFIYQQTMVVGRSGGHELL